MKSAKREVIPHGADGPKKEDPPQRIARRKYEEMNKERRRLASSNFQTMLPRELYDELDAFLKERHMTKVEFIRRAYEIMKNGNSGM